MKLQKALLIATVILLQSQTLLASRVQQEVIAAFVDRFRGSLKDLLESNGSYRFLNKHLLDMQVPAQGQREEGVDTCSKWFDEFLVGHQSVDGATKNLVQIRYCREHHFLANRNPFPHVWIVYRELEREFYNLVSSYHSRIRCKPWTNYKEKFYQFSFLRSDDTIKEFSHVRQCVYRDMKKSVSYSFKEYSKYGVEKK